MVDMPIGREPWMKVRARGILGYLPSFRTYSLTYFS